MGSGEGNILGVGVVEDPGAEAPGRQRDFENLQTMSCENCKRRIILGDFRKN